MHPKLLLADDSVTIQRVIELTFADEDVAVVAVGDGRQAIERVRADPPDIVLADVGMPDVDGYDVAAFIKGDPALAHIPVLLLTGAFEPVDEARARAVGCDGVLVKPFEPQMVISRVRELLAGNRGAGSPVSPPRAPVAIPEDSGSLEDYFDRLDAALASKGVPTSTLEPVSAPPDPAFAVKTSPTAVPVPSPMAELDLAGWTPPEEPEPVAKAARAAAPALADQSVPSLGDSSRSSELGLVAAPPTPSAIEPNLPTSDSSISLDQAFAALLAAEQGQSTVSIPRRADLGAREWPDTVPDAVIDAVVTKVIARMGDETMRSAVLDAAERLVREEIDRIKNAR